MDFVDGYDELPPEVQEKVKRALEQGHVDDEDWNGDKECNRYDPSNSRQGMFLKKTPKKKAKKVSKPPFLYEYSQSNGCRMRTMPMHSRHRRSAAARRKGTTMRMRSQRRRSGPRRQPPSRMKTTKKLRHQRSRAR